MKRTTSLLGLLVLVLALAVSVQTAHATECWSVSDNLCASNCQHFANLYNDTFGASCGYIQVRASHSNCSGDGIYYPQELTSCTCEFESTTAVWVGNAPTVVNGFFIDYSEDTQAMDDLICDGYCE